MKKVILMAAVTILSVTACEKEGGDAIPTSVTKEKSTHEKTGGGVDGVSHYREFQENDAGTRWGCLNKIGSCMKTVVVNGMNIPFDPIPNLYNEVENGTGADVINAMTTDYTSLSDDISSEVLDAAIAGDLTLDIKDFNDEQERFIFFKDAVTGENVLVVPFKGAD